MDEKRRCKTYLTRVSDGYVARCRAHSEFVVACRSERAAERQAELHTTDGEGQP